MVAEQCFIFIFKFQFWNFDVLNTVLRLHRLFILCRVCMQSLKPGMQLLKLSDIENIREMHNKEVTTNNLYN